MGDEVSNLIERRQLLRGVIDVLAQPLEGDARTQFLASAEARLNRECPAPGKQHMRMYLKAVGND